MTGGRRTAAAVALAVAVTLPAPAPGSGLVNPEPMKKCHKTTTAPGHTADAMKKCKRKWKWPWD
jgi:hypothetical protein